MREQLYTRLETLRREFEAGQAELDNVERRRTHLRDSLWRISGAIQVLEELLADAPPSGPNGAARSARPPVPVDAGEGRVS